MCFPFFVRIKNSISLRTNEEQKKKKYEVPLSLKERLNNPEKEMC